MNIGFIGLGNLGQAIASRLLDQGTSLVVWNRTRRDFKHPQAEWAATPQELLSRCDLVFMCLFDSDAVDEVLNGRQGLLKEDCREKIIVDLTTNHFQRVPVFHSAAGKQGGHYLESPVLGSVIPASQGNLTILVSGESAIFETARPYLSRFGHDIYFLEQPGLASKLKVINNLVLGSFMATIAEAVAFGEAAGLPRDQVLNILNSGAGNSGVLKAKTGKLSTEDFSPHFSVDAIYKDLHFVQDLARVMRRPVFTASVVKELFGSAVARGYGDRDFSAIYNVFKDMK